MPTFAERGINPNVIATPRSLIRSISDFAPKDLPAISLGLGELSYRPPQAVTDAMHKALDTEGVNKYTPNNGIIKLREAIAQDLKNKHGIERGTDDVIVTVGSTEALFVLFHTFAAPGNKVIIPEIGYTAYASDANLVGLRRSLYKLDANFEPNVESIISELDADGTNIVILNSPSNPTGHVVNQETIERLAERIAARKNVVFVSDDIYEDFVYDDKKVVSIARYLPDSTVTVGGLSKSASITGYRLGWMSGPSDIMQQAGKLHGFMVSSADSIAQYGALPVLQGECRQDIERFRNDLVRKRDLMMSQLQLIEGIRVAKPEGAFYCFVDVSNFGKSLEVSRKIIEKTGVVTTPGIAFGEAADNYIRLSYAADDDIIIRGIQMIKGVFEQWQ